MVAFAVNPLSTVALTENQFEPVWDDPAAESVALTRPQKQAFAVPARTSTYHVVVTSNAPSAARVLPDWVRPTIVAFIGIQNLTDNWNSYGGKAVTRELINQALSILGAVMQPDSPAPSVVPLGDGGLQIEWHRRQQDLEIVFPADEAPQFFYRNAVTGLLDEGSAGQREKLIGFVKDLI